MKKQFLLEGLDCANCAAKLEQAIAQLPCVKEATIDFMALKMTLDTGESLLEEALPEIERVIARVEPDVRLRPFDHSNSKPPSRSCHEKACGGGRHEHGGPCHEEECCGCPQGEEEDFALGAEEPHSHGDKGFFRTQVIRIIGCGIILAAAMLLPDMSLISELLMYVIAYLFIGGDVLWRALKNLLHGHIFDENFLMSIATVGAFCIGEYAEGVGVMLFYQVGELFQHYAVNRSRQSIAGLMDIRPDRAFVLVDGELVEGAPEDVEVGDILLVKPGERIPLDGCIVEGSSTLDTSALTGESLPREVRPGSDVLSGCINLTSPLQIRATHEYGESTVSKILDLVENAGSRKAKAEHFITKFARYYTPIVVGVAVLLAVLPPLVMGGGWSAWVYRALSFLVVSCPCALVISIPLGFFGGIGGASRRGILVKGGNYLESLANLQTLVFDKTGTLTKGVFAVTKTDAVGCTGQELLELAAYVESYSNHPIAQSILAAYGKEIIPGRVSDVEEIAGQGLQAKVDGRRVLVGNARLMQSAGIALPQENLLGTRVHLALEGTYAGHLVISDQVKPDAKAAVQAVKAAGVKKTVMLTGDAGPVAEAVARELGIDEVHAELLPADKVAQVESLLKEESGKARLAFVGDGINDAPVLARADVGIAMGGLGSDAAIEAADVVLMTDEPSRIADAIYIARRTLRIVKQNIAIALIIKLFILILVALGASNMWEAVFADVGVSVIAILNSMRALKVAKKLTK